MLLAAVIACLGSFSVATAANYAANSADSFVTAWNQAAASNEASTITITVPAGSDNITLTQEQRAQLNAISGTGNVTVQMADPSGKLVNFNYDLVNGQVSFNDITLSEPLGSDNDIVVTNATDTTTIDGRNMEVACMRNITTNAEIQSNDMRVIGTRPGGPHGGPLHAPGRSGLYQDDLRHLQQFQRAGRGPGQQRHHAGHRDGYRPDRQ